MNEVAQPGYAAGIYRAGQLVHVETSGMADLAAATPIEAATVFNIASVSKQFTAFAVLLAEQKGLLHRDDPLTRHVPELAALAPNVTLRHLVHHTSGLPDYIVLLFDKGYSIHEVTTPADALTALRVARPESEPGQCFAYSNSNYFLLSLCIERVTGQSLASFSAEQIFAPLGMAHTKIVDRYPAQISPLARGYQKGAADDYVLCETAWEQTGDGQVHTSIADFAHWDAHLRNGELGGRRLLDLLATPWRIASGEPIPYACGLILGSMTIGSMALGPGPEQLVIGHDGAWAGYRASYLRLLQKDCSVVVLANSAEIDVAAFAKGLVAKHL